MTGTDTQVRSVYVWVCEGTWRATVDAALDLAPAGARFTLLHITPAEVPERGPRCLRLPVRPGPP